MITPEEIITIEEVTKEQEGISIQAELEIDNWLVKEFNAPTNYSSNQTYYNYHGRHFNLLTYKYQDQLIEKYRRVGWDVERTLPSPFICFSRKNLK